METPTGHDRKLLVCLYEFMGQIFFMYAVLVSAGTGSAFAGLVGPLALFVSVSIFGAVTGGHFNPAVTLGVYFREAKYKDNFLFMAMIISSQISGAITGMLLSYLVLRIPDANGDITVLPQSVPLLLPSKFNYATLMAASQPGAAELTLDETFSTTYMEVICTFMFVFFILHVTGKHTVGPDLGVWGLQAICLILWAMISVDGFTGASFNPALAIGQTIFMVWWYPYNPQRVLTHYLWQYAVGAALGGVLAGLAYQLHHKMFIKEHEEENNDNENYGK